MTTREFVDQAWNRLARRASGTPPETPGLPLGFATRVVAVWKSSPGESFFAALEGLTWRGLAVAFAIFCACALFGYDSMVTAVGGEAARAGSVLREVLGL